MAGPIEMFLWNGIEWLNPIVHAIGLVLALWAFRCCRRWGYLVVGFYFFLVLFSLLAMPSINRMIRARQAPDYSAQTQQRIDAAVREAIDKVLAEEGRPYGVPITDTVHFPFGPIVLVLGLWLIARRDAREGRANQALEATADPLGS